MNDVLAFGLIAGRFAPPERRMGFYFCSATVAW